MTEDEVREVREKYLLSFFIWNELIRLKWPLNRDGSDFKISLLLQFLDFFTTKLKLLKGDSAECRIE